MTQNYYIRNKVTKAITNTISWDGATLINVPDGYEAVPCSQVPAPVFEVSKEQLESDRREDLNRKAEELVGDFQALLVAAFLSTQPKDGTPEVEALRRALAVYAERDAAIAEKREPVWPKG